ncbi:Sigma-E factor regulatory protein RseC [Thiorhodovibrio winogradskyi]|uniref:Sigma-E factor regulatory protein RseC n=1 Tax=Thiorhodovibrio winogradskyi TaxID=77007 RepID=A0ABZ0S6R7_9GAMM|nr:SoxR reducing system RseC family protein [Thiorhodovibrio winogradskyi]
MIEQPARVLDVLPETPTQPARLYLEVTRRPVCGGCAHASGCGTAVLAELFGRGRFGQSPLRMELPMPAASKPPRPGDDIQLGIAPGALLGAAVLAYVLPVLLMLLGAGLGAQMAGDVLSVLLAALGLGAGLLLGGLLIRIRAAAGKSISASVLPARADSS